MGDNENRKVYKARQVKNYREMVEYSCKNYAQNIAYKYKKDYTAKKCRIHRKNIWTSRKRHKSIWNRTIKLRPNGRKNSSSRKKQIWMVH